MQDPTTIIIGLAATYLINIPFGYWRAGTKKLTIEWFAAIHAPIPLIAAYRILTGIPIKLLPAFIAAYFLGQATGTRIRRSRTL